MYESQLPDLEVIHYNNFSPLKLWLMLSFSASLRGEGGVVRRITQQCYSLRGEGGVVRRITQPC